MGAHGSVAMICQPWEQSSVSTSWGSSFSITSNYSQLKDWDEQLRNPQQLLHCPDDKNVQETIGDSHRFTINRDFVGSTYSKNLQVTLKKN